MKNVLLVSFFMLTFSALFAQIKTPASSPVATVTQAVGLTKITVEYSRPAVRGRKIFGDLVPFDKVWRTGANKITTIKFDDDVMVEGKKIAAGTYGWYTFPGKSQWTIALNTDDKQWGAYQYDSAKDVLRLNVKPEKTKGLVENMTITVEQTGKNTADVVLSWEKTAVRMKVEQNTHDKIMAEIKDKTAKADCTTDTYFDAAEYYLDHNHDLKMALTWADKVVEKDKQYWTYNLRANILAKLGQCAKAAEDAKMTVEMAKKEGDDSYVKRGEKVLKQCAGK
jgi:Protein of unknown function (DUF2911)